MKTLCSNAVFHVSTLEISIEFYREVLGFTVQFLYGNPSTYAGLRLGNVDLHISSQYPYKNNTGHGNLYIVCDDVESIYRKCLNHNAQFYSHLHQRDYGLNDFAVKDPDGNQIGFGEEVA